MDVQNNHSSKKCDFEEVLDLTGFGMYNVAMLVSCSLAVIGMYLDMLGLSVPLPVIACDLGLTNAQQGLLSAMPFIGITISSYAWGLFADTLGRKKILLIAMPIGILLNVATTFAPSFAALATLKLLSASFTSSSNAAGFVLMGESVGRKHRSLCMLLMASSTMSVQVYMGAIALPVVGLDFRAHLSWLGFDYTPWRLLLLLYSIPGLLGTIGVAILYESPKFLLHIKQGDQAMEVLQHIYNWNNSVFKKEDFHVDGVSLNYYYQLSSIAKEKSLISKIRNQTVPLFNPPLLKNSIVIYYLLMSVFMTVAGYCIWIPAITNAYFNGDDNTGKTFCDIASEAITPKNSTYVDCNSLVSPVAIYGVIIFSLGCTSMGILLAFTVKYFGKKRSTLLIFASSFAAGTLLAFVRIPSLSIAMLYLFNYVTNILGNANTYLVELNPTNLRGMGLCLSVMVARGFSFVGAQLFATYVTNFCIPMHIGFVTLIASGFFMAFFLPPDAQKRCVMDTEEKITAEEIRINKRF